MEPTGHRPEGAPGRCDRYLAQITRDLNRELVGMFRRLTRLTLRLPAAPRQEWAGILGEFAEDSHCGIGLWSALGGYNERLFGTRLPFLSAPGRSVPSGICRQRTQHLLWGVYAALWTICCGATKAPTSATSTRA